MQNKLTFSQWTLKKILKRYYVKNYNIEYVYKNFDPGKEGPYFLIGNHVLLLDALLSNFGIDGYALPVTNRFAYFGTIRRFALTYMIKSIAKRKGQSDLETIKNIMKELKLGSKISLYPEGNASFFGSNSDTVFSTAKLIKKMKVDVVNVKTLGGYLAKPRWRKGTLKQSKIVLEYDTILTKQQIDDLSIDEINDIVTSSYNFNDYEWNRVQHHKYIGKNRLKNSDLIMYYCPECNQIGKLSSLGDTLFCDCGMTTTMDDYGFLKGSKYDNFVDWGRSQTMFLKSNLSQDITIQTKIYAVDFEKYKIRKIDSGSVLLRNKQLLFHGKKLELSLETAKIKGEAYTEMKQVSFDYGDVTYMFISDKPKLMLDYIKLSKEADTHV